MFGLKDYFLEFSFIMCFPGVFFLFFVILLILIYLPTVLLLCLEQKDRSLEDHTWDFLDLASPLPGPFALCFLPHKPQRSKARLPVSGPREYFSAFVEWVLVYN